MARNKTKERNLEKDGPKSPKKKNSVSCPFKFREKNHIKKSLEGKFQKKIQTAISGTENTVQTDTGKIISRKFISGPLFQTERKARREPITMTSGEIQPKNRHCLRGLDGKYGRWDEILRDILNGKLKIVQNKKNPRARRKTKMMMTKTKRCRKRPETSHTTHPNKTEDMPRFKQIRRKTQYKFTLTVRYLVRI